MKASAIKTIGEVLYLLIIAILCLALTYVSNSYGGFADAVRYLASGDSLLTSGHGYNVGVSYARLESLGFINKTYDYPGQFFQLFIGAVVRWFDAPAQLSTLALANILPFWGTLYLFHRMLSASMPRLWALSCTSLFALADPFFAKLMVHNATEPWMVFFILLALATNLKGQAFISGLSAAIGYFFRAQIISTFPALLIVAGTTAKRLKMAAGIALAYFLSRLFLSNAFPTVSETTSSFYGRAFFKKYVFSFDKGLTTLQSNYGDYSLLFIAIGLSALFFCLSRLPLLSDTTKRTINFFIACTVVMVLFAAHMSCTVGVGVSDRYFVHLVCLAWLCLFTIGKDLPFLRALPVPAITPSLIVAGCLTFAACALPLSASTAWRNLHAEDIPAGFFDKVTQDSIVLTNGGAPEIALHAKPWRLAVIPPYEVFADSAFNCNADFIYLSARKGFLPPDWADYWNQTSFSDKKGVLFTLISSTETPQKTLKLFQRTACPPSHQQH